MKSALLLSTALLASAAHADVLGLTAEAGSYITNDGEDFNTYFGVAVEHPIPLIPNFRIQHQDLEGKVGSTKIDTSYNDYTLYYEFLDGLLWLDLDAGITLRSIDGSIGSTDVSDSYPLGYLSAYVTFPGTSLSVGGELKTGGGSDANITDTTFKIKYQALYFAGLEAGYRKVSENIDDIDGSSFDVDFTGVFIGAFVDF
ncbi:MAG: TIGR04219 family outer membrane beta-barrel protein [Gammaproteobacteria bacterium]|jgi:outer membrane protein|uniref:Outer membrane protein n=1 Tax=Marinomonas polaris DSM 16579 TaxID=1122206 RepID=A0A1M5M642_9GAMM|nr:MULTISPECIES: TIGR04219 family outer membrane beta-barrel protein [Marinomonas]MBU1297480.1 TIGR04219 family outer membrane beta-barrel protein [Gammaproteobacteria bacterium]MBU1466714.1 TIGR04219 family outer membrane beta-barrel protein [Gammaproteobacteria bacterium]MBU2024614.1 TIGR04219 family outer membrane beta-barrel protein [Gammaproteobacteria bacterium]MBU2237408.1 TIGR04219 family outer membrane beta-barrel protein [Gammaproteobacteria bacterium]MBU2317709.1 TIGR04219 family ou|tara:strand:+ start:92 stop:691 length:600 start_codon:yes stop_codon:yes gene_type:complete